VLVLNLLKQHEPLEVVRQLQRPPQSHFRMLLVDRFQPPFLFPFLSLSLEEPIVYVATTWV